MSKRFTIENLAAAMEELGPIGPSFEDQLPTVLTVDEAAQILRINRKTLYRLVKDGQVPGAKKIGRVIRIRLDSLLEWFAGKAAS